MLAIGTGTQDIRIKVICTRCSTHATYCASANPTNCYNAPSEPSCVQCSFCQPDRARWELNPLPYGTPPVLKHWSSSKGSTGYSRLHAQEEIGAPNARVM
jgi:hypothetical protein